MSKYSERLKDPQWQKRRLEILSNANFACQRCKCTSRTLHVHHNLYRKNTDPWDYPDRELMALCDQCHKREEAQREQMLALLCRFEELCLVPQMVMSLEALVKYDDPCRVLQWMFCVHFPELLEKAETMMNYEILETKKHHEAIHGNV